MSHPSHGRRTAFRHRAGSDSIMQTRSDNREDHMMQMPRTGFAGSHAPACMCCSPQGGVSRRQFLCTTALGAVAAPALATSVVGTAKAQQAPSGATAPGRAILIKGGTVLTLDRA